ncbi:MAG: putative signal transducing protein [Psychroflexus sp.]
MLEKVFSTKSKIEFMGVKHRLEENGIKVYDIDKTDRSYSGIFGQIEIQVNTEDKDKALSIIEDYFKDE